MGDCPDIAVALQRYVLETASLMMLQLDAQNRVVGANDQALRVLGTGAVGRPLAEQIMDFRHTLDVSALIRQGDTVHRLTLSTASGRPETFCFRFFSLASGTLALASLDFQEQVELRDQVLALNRELNNLTRQLHQSNAELRDLNQLKNQFLGMAAHDLRKPIGVIMTYGGFVLDEAGLSEEHRGFLGICLKAATDMKQLIDGFLDLAVIESGQLRLNLAPATVREIVTGAEPMARLMAEKKGIVLLVEPTDDLRCIHVDMSKLQQVLLNLVGNAVEHSVSGQRVWLSSRWEGQDLIFAVCDEGPGIPPADQPRLFTAFGRTGLRKTAGERSTGLGLAIARLVIEAHGGRIWIENGSGHGARFVFSLPTKEGEYA